MLLMLLYKVLRQFRFVAHAAHATLQSTKTIKVVAHAAHAALQSTKTI